MKPTTLLALTTALLASCSSLDKQLAKYDLTTADVIAATLATKTDLQARQSANRAAAKNPVSVQP
jgi:hypothetical protein